MHYKTEEVQYKNLNNNTKENYSYPLKILFPLSDAQ